MTIQKKKRKNSIFCPLDAIQILILKIKISIQIEGVLLPCYPKKDFKL